jgi:sulfite reductase alpha subunit-like flavoprotein
MLLRKHALRRLCFNRERKFVTTTVASTTRFQPSTIRLASPTWMDFPPTPRSSSATTCQPSVVFTIHSSSSNNRYFSTTKEDNSSATTPSEYFIFPLSSRRQPIRILYASQGGTAKLLAEELQQTLQDELNLNVTCESLSEIQSLQPGHALHIFVVSTSGVGQPPDSGQAFYQQLMEQSDSLQNLEYAVFGLGNSKAHPIQYNAFGKALDGRLATLGAKRIQTLAMGDADATFEDFEAYTETLLDLLRGDDDDSPAEAHLRVAYLNVASRNDGPPSVFRTSDSRVNQTQPSLQLSPTGSSTRPSTLSLQPSCNMHHQQQLRFLTTSLRRRRIKYEKFNEAQMQQSQGTLPSTAIDNPFEYSGDSLEEYRAKANLSPWTPVPDSVARKIFDSANPGPDDVSGGG